MSTTSMIGVIYNAIKRKQKHKKDLNLPEQYKNELAQKNKKRKAAPPARVWSGTLLLRYLLS